MADVSEKLERIDTSVANMRTSLGLTEANTIEEVASNIDKLKENNAKLEKVTSNGNTAQKLIAEINDISFTSNVTNFSNFFQNFYGLKKISFDKNSDFSKVTNMSNMFNTCTKLETIPELNTSNVTSMESMFAYCNSLIAIPEMNTSKVTNMNSMFYNCSKLTAIPTLDCSNVKDIGNNLGSCSHLENIGGFINLGKNYNTTATAGYSQYTLRIADSPTTTHDSLMNVINNLYDIATKGCKAQKLILGSTLLAKLTSEEIAIATNKGWTVS